MLKRIFDIIISALGIVTLFPFFLIIALFVRINSKGPIYFTQKRVGRYGKDFNIIKFRSMYVGSEDNFPLTIGEYDKRVTKVGRILRNYKLDELPQLLNVLKGDMSMVGPRPVLRKFVDYYNEEQMHILDVKPGITDYASIKYRNEGELLEKAQDPLDYYLNVIMPDKLRLNKRYLDNMSFWIDLQLIFKTIFPYFHYSKD